MELGYATTIARTQGMTDDETHAIATSGMGREDLYVAMSRGRHSNRAYVVDGDPECLPGKAPSSGREVLEQILATSHAEPSPTEAEPSPTETGTPTTQAGAGPSCRPCIHGNR